MKKMLALFFLLLSVTFFQSVFLFPETISVATVNAWSGLTYKGFFSSGRYEDVGDRILRYENLYRELEKLAPDILAINEANPLPSYIEKLATDLDYDYIYNVGRGGLRIGSIGIPSNLREGDAILAAEDLELEKIDRRQITGGPVGNTFSFQLGETCQVLVGRITIDNQDIFVFVTQWTESTFADKEILESVVASYTKGETGSKEFLDMMREAVEGSELRISQAEMTLDFINEIAAVDQVVLMGSLNMLPDSPEMTLLKEAGFKDAFELTGRGSGYTYDATKNTNIIDYFPEISKLGQRFRIDYILVRGDKLQVRDCSVFMDTLLNGSHASDHFGVKATIEVLK